MSPQSLHSFSEWQWSLFCPSGFSLLTFINSIKFYCLLFKVQAYPCLDFKLLLYQVRHGYWRSTLATCLTSYSLVLVLHSSIVILVNPSGFDKFGYWPLQTPATDLYFQAFLSFRCHSRQCLTALKRPSPSGALQALNTVTGHFRLQLRVYIQAFISVSAAFTKVLKSSWLLCCCTAFTTELKQYSYGACSSPALKDPGPSGTKKTTCQPWYARRGLSCQTE